jgi:cytidine deaminase
MTLILFEDFAMLPGNVSFIIALRFVHHSPTTGKLQTLEVQFRVLNNIITSIVILHVYSIFTLNLSLYYLISPSETEYYSMASSEISEQAVNTIFRHNMQEGLDKASALVAAAQEILTKIPPHNNHSVVAAALTKDCKIITGCNVFHFTGGPCAEPVVFGAAAAQGYLPHDLTHMVAVVRRTNDVISPCGKCRQMFYDFCPSIQVVVKDEGVIKLVTVDHLMPFAYVNKESLKAREIMTQEGERMKLEGERMKQEGEKIKQEGELALG